MKNKFEIAENLFFNSQYDEAFNMFKKFEENNINSNLDRAEALNMMGVIVSGFAPHLGVKNSSDGLYYYLKAVYLNSNCLSALFNIVFHFEEKSLFKDNLLFIVSYEKLKNDLFDALSEEQKKALADKYDLYLKVKQ